MAEIRAEIAANVWQVVAEEGQMVAEGDEIVILESMKMEIPVVTEIPGVVRELHVEPEQVVQEGDLIAIIDESRDVADDPLGGPTTGVGIATIDRPERRNALNADLCTQLLAISKPSPTCGRS